EPVAAEAKSNRVPYASNTQACTPAKGTLLMRGTSGRADFAMIGHNIRERRFLIRGSRSVAGMRSFSSHHVTYAPEATKRRRQGRARITCGRSMRTRLRFLRARADCRKGPSRRLAGHPRAIGEPVCRGFFPCARGERGHI